MRRLTGGTFASVGIILIQGDSMNGPGRRGSFGLLAGTLAMALALAAGADILLLKDGRKIEGTVTDKGDSYEVKTGKESVTVKKSEVRERKATGRRGKDPEQEAAALVEAAAKAVKRRAYSEAKRILERVVRQHADTAAAEEARRTLQTMPNALGRLVLSFDKAPETRPAFVKGGSVRVESIVDDKMIRQGSGAAHVIIDSAQGATLVKFAIPEQNLERLRMVSFWMHSEAKLHQKRTMKLCLFSPGGVNFLDANIVGADANGWKLVRVMRGQFKGLGGGFAADLSNGRPTWKKIDGIGFLLPVENYRDFILDDVRILD
jgi:hypothetical protein